MPTKLKQENYLRVEMKMTRELNFRLRVAGAFEHGPSACIAFIREKETMKFDFNALFIRVQCCNKSQLDLTTCSFLAAVKPVR